MQDNSNPSNSSGKGCVVAFIVVVLILIVTISSCNSNIARENRADSEAFGRQMQKDPNKWTQDEKSRYNNFMDWLDKQDGK